MMRASEQNEAGRRRRIVVKIGSNVLTRADGTLDSGAMGGLVDQVAELCKAGVEVIVVSSGAVASGRGELAGRLTGRFAGEGLDSVSARQLFSAVGQIKLIDRYYNLFRDQGIVCGQVLTTKESLGSEEAFLNQKNCMEVMLACGVVPIVNENDTISITELMFTDNDELSGLMSKMMAVDLLVILSNIDGLYTGSPDDPYSELVREVSAADGDLSGYVHASRSPGGRGGMLTKSRIAREVAAAGIEVVIANGKRAGILTEVVLRRGEAVGGGGVVGSEGADMPFTRFVPVAK